MTASVINRDYLLGAIVGTAPQLKRYFESVLQQACYTVSELNTLFRYELIKMSNNTMAVRDWLCPSGDTDMWVYYFCKEIVPFISKVFSHQCQSPDAMVNSLLGG